MPRGRSVHAAVVLGSSLGAVVRYLASAATLHALGPGFPWATLFVNVAGSVLVGFYATLSGPDGRILASPATRQFVLAGFCGGLTTFSIFSLETLLLVVEGRELLASVNVLASLILWVPGAWGGHALARRLNRLPRSVP